MLVLLFGKAIGRGHLLRRCVVQIDRQSRFFYLLHLDHLISVLILCNHLHLFFHRNASVRDLVHIPHHTAQNLFFLFIHGHNIHTVHTVCCDFDGVDREHILPPDGGNTIRRFDLQNIMGVRLFDLSNAGVVFFVQLRRRLAHEHPILCRFIGKEHAEGRRQKRPHHTHNEDQHQNRRRRGKRCAQPGQYGGRHPRRRLPGLCQQPARIPGRLYGCLYSLPCKLARRLFL